MQFISSTRDYQTSLIVTGIDTLASVYRCLHGIGPEYFSEDFRLVSEIQSRQRLRSASSTDVVVPATRRSSLGDRAFQSQELERGTHCRPVSPPHHLCPHSGDS